MSPSLRPTAKPCAWRVRTLCSFEIVSMFVVSAAEMASPFMLGSGAIPHPSWTLQVVVNTSKHVAEAKGETYMRQTLFLT